ncbi:predicted protein [Nematostella vectensis]|uniref:Myb/SANT-like DNA-binding domain-containing protein n=1 Tax=Nematostella vectensis TaxID=45351 RepID=A7RNU6_NEMVE|nr:predicted protein [Nematostella vectensis]|eukprot:XP_001639052.1 predicted protein [Nematostella vectensis]
MATGTTSSKLETGLNGASESSNSPRVKSPTSAHKPRQKATNWGIEETRIFLEAWKTYYDSLETASYLGKNTIWNKIYEQYRSGCISDGLSVNRNVYQLKKRVQNLTYQYKQFRGPTAACIDEETRARINKVFPYFDFFNDVITGENRVAVRRDTNGTSETKLAVFAFDEQLKSDRRDSEPRIAVRNDTSESGEAKLTVFAYDEEPKDKPLPRRQSALNTRVSPESEESAENQSEASDHQAAQLVNNRPEQSDSSSEEEETDLVVVDIPELQQHTAPSPRKRLKRQTHVAVNKRPEPKLTESVPRNRTEEDGFRMSALEEMWERKLAQDREQFEKLMEFQRESLQVQQQQTNAIISGLTNILNTLAKNNR